MSNLISRIFGNDRRNSSRMAKDRLSIVLVHDRSDLSPTQLQALKDELLEVIARYVQFDPEAVELDLMTEDRTTLLKAEIPIQAGGRRRAALEFDD